MQNARIKKIVEAEFNEFASQKALNWIKPRLEKPEKKILHWEYGNQEAYIAWIVADMGERNVVAVYCEEGGFGAMGAPWGIVFRNETNFGMDCGWYKNFEQLILDGWI